MRELIVCLYEGLRKRPGLRWISLIILTLAMMALGTEQTYKEDISEFLPLGERYRSAMEVYQQTSGADRILVIFEHRDQALEQSGSLTPDGLVDAVDRYVDVLYRNDSEHLVRDLTSEVDLDRMRELVDFVYDNIPYFITEKDYERMDSLLREPDYVREQIASDKRALMLPGSGLLTGNLQRDPLNLYTPVVARLQQMETDIRYEQYEGHILTPDLKRAIVMLRSSFGASETDGNSRLVSLLEQVADSVKAELPDIDVNLIGGPVIAVGNAQRIKTDSLLSVTLAVVLIAALLFVVFRRVWPLMLIVLSILWGWLFAMGMLAAVRDSVSVIVIGISSVIIGIAVNYPLHLMVHLQHTSNIKTALKETVMPLLVGNITTVGAFLSLVPLKSTALRDLGLFSAFLLIGTILFVLLYLPHLLSDKCKVISEEGIVMSDECKVISDKPWIVSAVIVLTLVFGYFSLDTEFDSDISHINYMTDRQRSVMEYFQQLMAHGDNGKLVYAVSADSTADAALDKSLALQPVIRQMEAEGLITHHSSLITPSLAEQQRRLERWKGFVESHEAQLTDGVWDAARLEGFALGTFDSYLSQLWRDYQPQEISYFEPLSPITSRLLAYGSSPRVTYVVDLLQTTVDRAAEVEERLPLAFDAEGMNRSITTSLSDDFNYIGWACGLIVFLFLWLSLGCIELAILSFLPMAVSWLWILGIMSILGIQFNVVNIILATFIFGQGDDYTIFMTEGCQYEYAFRKRMLASYKNGIIISALIMLIGIGSLILARHPALHSLAEVTIIGMMTVVLMAYIFPPLIFRWLVYSKGKERLCPLTLSNMLRRRNRSLVAFVADCYRYRGVEISMAVNRSLRRCRDSQMLRQMAPDRTERARQIILIDEGWGERSMLLALSHPDVEFVCVCRDMERSCVARHAAEHRAKNLTVCDNITSIQNIMKDRIRTMLEDALPLVDFDSDFLFSELDSLGVTTILMMLSEEFGIKLEATDATPKNFKTLDSIVAMVMDKCKVMSDK